MNVSVETAFSKGAAAVSRKVELLRWMVSLPDVALIVCAMLLTLVLGVPNLDLNPPISYDEGYVLQAPHNLLTQGFYGTRSADEQMPFDTHVSTGPTVLLPVWATFALLGEDLTPARLVVVFYGMLAVAAGYLLMLLVYERWVAFLAAILLSFSLYPYDRTVLGEVPALFWVLAGAWLWLSGLREPVGRRRVLFGGLCFGLAVLTKLAFLPILGLTLLLVTMRAWLGGGRQRFSPSLLVLTFAGLVSPLAAWYGVQVFLLGPAGVVDRFQAVGLYQAQFVDLSQEHLLENFSTFSRLIPAGLAGWLAPAVLLATIQLTRGGGRAAELSFLPFLLATSLTYYLLSVGWERYAFWSVAVAVMLIAPLPLFFARTALDQTAQTYPRAIRVVSVVLALVLVTPSAVSSLNAIAYQDDDAFATAAFLRDQVSDGEVVGSTEREIDFLTRIAARYPPTYLATAPRERIESSFDWSWPGTDWVITGGIGKFLGAQDRLEKDPHFVARLNRGPYSVFQRQVGPLQGWAWDTRGATQVPLSAGRPTVGQNFFTPYRTITDVRVLLAGENRVNNASVTLNIYDDAASKILLGSATIDGSEIQYNEWYTFSLGKLSLTPRQRGYFELVSEPAPGQNPVGAWYNDSVDNYRDGQWYRGREPQQGDLYFGILGSNKGAARPVLPLAAHAD